MGYMYEIEHEDAMDMKEHIKKSLYHAGKAMDIAEEMCESVDGSGGMGERRYGSRSRYGGRYGGRYGSRYGNRDMDNLDEEMNDMEDVAPGDEMGERRGRYGGRNSRSRIYY